MRWFSGVFLYLFIRQKGKHTISDLNIWIKRERWAHRTPHRAVCSKFTDTRNNNNSNGKWINHFHRQFGAHRIDSPVTAVCINEWIIPFFWTACPDGSMSMMQRELKINAYQPSNMVERTRERERKVKQKTAHYYYKLCGDNDNYVLNEIRSRMCLRTQHTHSSCSMSFYRSLSITIRHIRHVERRSL